MDENPDIAARMDAFVKDSGMDPTCQTGYSVFEIPMEKDENRLDDVSFGQDAVYADFITLDDYNALENTDVKLGPDEVLVYGMREKYGFDSMHLLGTEYKAKELDSFSENNPNEAIVNDTYLMSFLPVKPCCESRTRRRRRPGKCIRTIRRLFSTGPDWTVRTRTSRRTI